jgi:hypothetical protein
MPTTISQYINQVDAEVDNIAGLSIHDLPDYDFATALESGQTPEETAIEVLEGEGYSIH